jgi:serine/threonine protein kinase
MNAKDRRALKFAERESWMSLKDEREIMVKLHEKESQGRRFIIKPDMELTKVANTDCIMTPFYGLTVEQAIVKWKGDEQTIKRFAKGLCLGLKHMHDVGFAHRDIKEANVLM